VKMGNMKLQIRGILMIIYGNGLQGLPLESTFEASAEQILSIIRANICQMEIKPDWTPEDCRRKLLDLLIS
jgi:hypothetical protein